LYFLFLAQYELTDRKRQEDRERREREKAKEKESAMSTKEKYSKRRKEIWIHPDGGKRSHRTTSTTEPTQDIDEEELSKLSQSEVNIEYRYKIISIVYIYLNLLKLTYVYTLYIINFKLFFQVNKRFIVSFLHVHGKLFTKVG